MKKRTLTLFILASFFLALTTMFFAVRSATLALPSKMHFSPYGYGQLSAETITFFKNLQSPIHLTYYATRRRHMPSNMKRVERDVAAVLKQIQARAPDYVSYEVLDPSRDPKVQKLAARRKISPIHMDNIIDDQNTEETIWSGLNIARPPYRDVVIKQITENHTDHLDALIVGHLKNMEQPIRPTLGLAAPENDYNHFARFMRQEGFRVLRVDFNQTAELPDEVDLLFLFEPTITSLQHSRALLRFLATGRNVVIADSLYRIRPGFSPEGKLMFDLLPKKDPAVLPLLRSFGVEMQPAVVMDQRSYQLSVQAPDGSTRTFNAPFMTTTVPFTHNFKDFAGPSRGTLSFFEATILKPARRTLEKLNLEWHTVVTSSEEVWTLPLVPTQLSEADVSPTIFKPKQELAAMLKHVSKPFHGRMLIFGSTSTFRNEDFFKQGLATRPFLKLLGRTFLSAEELVKMRVDQHLPPPFEPTSAVTLTFWRLLTMLLIPIALIIIAAFRFRAARSSFALPVRSLNIAMRMTLVIVAVFIAIKALSVIFQGMPQADFTQDKVNSIAKITQQRIQQLDTTLHAELFISRKHHMPASMKQAQAQITKLLDAVGRAGGKNISTTIVHPETLSNENQRALIEGKIAPFDVRTTTLNSETTQKIWCALRLSTPQDQTNLQETLPRITPQNIPQLETYLVMLLEHLQRGRPVHIAIASDLPRLSPAEAFEDYQKKQLLAPVGSDVYSEAKKVLSEKLFQVSHIDPEKANVPRDADVLIWLQPRRPMDRMAQAFAKFIATGGKGILAMQHFNIQQRQYSGRGFSTVYWPQPQYMDLNSYLASLGIQLEREVLMDESQSSLSLETQINRLAQREHDKQTVAKPFLIRAINPHFSSSSPITRNLGDLLFIWGNRFVIDLEKLTQHGLQAETLISTSSRCWRYQWSGGFLKDEVFTERDYMEAPQSLAVLISGTFPPSHRWKVAEDEFAESDQPKTLKPEPERKPGSLLVIGNSEMFKNPHLNTEYFDHAQFLLNAVTYMALGPEATALQSRKSTAHGFELPSKKTMVGMRLWTMAAAPLLALTLGMIWFTKQNSKQVIAFGRNSA